MANIELYKLTIYILSAIIGIGFILMFVKNGIEYMIFGGLTTILLSFSSYLYYNLPHYWNLIFIIPLFFAIMPAIMFFGLTGILDHQGLGQE